MGFSRKEVYYWMETASDKQLQSMLSHTKELMSMLTDSEQLRSTKWLREKVIEEIQARTEATQA